MAKCYVCDAVLKDIKSLQRHNLRFHKTSSCLPKLECATCHGRFRTNDQLESHISKIHNEPIVHEKSSFINEDEFNNWKRSVEAMYTAKYVRSRFHKYPGRTVAYYICNRSGRPRISVSDETRKRRVKLNGSRKFGSHCPSRIIATFHVNGSVNVDFCKTHFGHAPDLKHLPVSSPVKKKISAKIPLSEILNEVKQSATNAQGELHRGHSMTDQHLRNIIKQFSLEGEWFLESDDAACVTTWVSKERELDEDSSVILFKPKGIMPAHLAHLQNDDEVNNVGKKNGLKKSDFLLAIMTKSQLEVLKIYGEKGVIAMDSTLKTNSYGFELTTLMVLDDLKQGFPAAFFISNRADSFVMQIFLESVKNKTGLINAKTFMSYVTEVFYNAWCSVMGRCQFWLFCTWHVIRAWQQKIKELIKIETKREETYSNIYTLLTETDENVFEVMLQTIVNQLCNEEDSSAFGVYFKENYAKRSEQWAYCHRKKAGINRNMHLERLHKSIKHIFLKGKIRLDCTIHALTRLINWKVHERLVSFENGKLSYKMKALRKRHSSATILSTDNIVSIPLSNSWTVFSETVPTDSYIVVLVDPNCSCSLHCDLCKTCTHKFTCTCIDYCIKSNMCKHIHLVCRFLSEEGHEATEQPKTVLDDNEAADEESPELCIDVQENPETRALFNNLRRDGGMNDLPDLESKKRRISELFSSLLDNIKTNDGADALAQVLKKGIPIVEAAENLRSQVRSVDSMKKVKTSKKMEPQRKLKPRREELVG